MLILAQLMTIAIEGSEPELVDFDAGLEIIKLAIKHSWALHMKMFSPFFLYVTLLATEYFFSPQPTL